VVIDCIVCTDVVQYALDLKMPQVVAQITEAMLGSMTVLSRQKFSSNVVEKVIVVSTHLK